MRIILANSRNEFKRMEVEMQVLPRVGEEVVLVDDCEPLVRKDGKGDALDPSPNWKVNKVVHAFLPVYDERESGGEISNRFLMPTIPKVYIENEEAI